MNNKQQTAVEWFFEQLTEVDYNCINKTFLQNNNSLAGYRLRELLKQAKEMEKTQIKKAWADGNYNTDDDGNPSENYSISDEHYYEQTYGGN
jgi:hypothetical protein